MGDDDGVRRALEELKEAAGSLVGDKGLKEAVRVLQGANDKLRRQLVELEAPKRQSDEPRTHLVIGDPHSDPLWDNDRFGWLGKAINDIAPDVVVCLGDFATLGSLGQYDRGKLRGEGQRLTDDINTCHDALWRINNSMDDVPCEKWMCLGNHDDRIARYTNDRPELAGTYTAESLGFEEHGWQVAQFLYELEIDGVVYVHHASTATGRAVSGKYLGANVLGRYLRSVVVGHSHRLSYQEQRESRTFGLSAGCFFEHDEDYATPFQSRDWWRGVVVLKGVVDGYPGGGVEFIPLDQIQRRYS